MNVPGCLSAATAQLFQFVSDVGTWMLPPVFLAIFIMKLLLRVPSVQMEPSEEKKKKTKFVIVGSGITGLAAARTICKNTGDESEVTIVEAADRLGGHAFTIDGPKPTCEKMDIGFMVILRFSQPASYYCFAH